MAQKKSGWNPMTWFGGGTARKVDHRRTLALEALESREVPATIVVTNLLDSTNPTVPLTGSLREAVTRLAVSGDEIRFADSLFPEGEGPKTLVLNGAVGALQARTLHHWQQRLQANSRIRYWFRNRKNNHRWLQWRHQLQSGRLSRPGIHPVHRRSPLPGPGHWPDRQHHPGQRGQPGCQQPLHGYAFQHWHWVLIPDKNW